MSQAKYINIKEFREQGYLFEVNRQFFHPLGLALEVSIDENGNESLEGIWDCRNDPEGVTYHESVIKNKNVQKNVERIEKEWWDKSKYRAEVFGFTIQPINENGSDE